MGTTQTHEFQTEAQELLNLMIHSLYSNKDVFLRELISNASDALDKLRFEGIENPGLLPEDELHILLEVDRDNRVLRIHDNGVGMTRQEVIDNIGTIAKSGTRAFREMLDQSQKADNPELIGQFGVGFYASFMVADKVVLTTLRAGTDEATQWESDGKGSYTVSDTMRAHNGTTIELHLKPVDDDAGLKDFTEEWVLRDIVRRYSDFVGYPIKLECEKHEPVVDKDGKPVEGSSSKVTRELLTLNSMKAIWTRSPSEVSDEEYDEFYRHVSHDWNPPLARVRTVMEGAIEAQALLYIPKQAPFDLYHREMKTRGVQFYVKRVFIMDECKELLPDYLRFVKGVVDAADLPLNVSREMLQQDRHIRAIRKHLVKKIHDQLKSLKENEFEKYLEFWGQFGPALKEGLVGFDTKHEDILPLVLAYSTHEENKLTSLSDYVARMKDGQDEIYYLTAPSLEAGYRSPHLEAFKEKGFEVLVLTDPVDEVWLQQVNEFEGKKLRSIGQGEVDLRSDEEKEKAKESEAEFKDLMPRMRAVLQDDVKEVRLSSRLSSSAACLVTEEGDLTPQMEMLMRQSGQKVPKVKRILEVNPNHDVIKKLGKAMGENGGDPIIDDYAKLLYGQAKLAEGGAPDDPASFAKLVADVMARAL